MHARQDFRLRTATYAAAAAYAMVAAVVAPRAAAAELGRADVRCITALNDAFVAAGRAMDADLGTCIGDGARDKLDGLTVEDCVLADRKGKLFDAFVDALVAEAFECSQRTASFGARDGIVVATAGILSSLDIARDALGGDFDAATVAADGDTLGLSKCQRAVLAQARKCRATKLSELERCQKSGLTRRDPAPVATREELQALCLEDGESGGIPDARDKIEKACVTKLADTLAKRCEGIDATAAFPALPGLDVASELERAVECRVCLAANLAGNLRRDCDLFDDGAADTSCGPTCGDGLLEFGEQCDDGGTEGADGCDGTCAVELPATLSIVNMNILHNATAGAVGYDDLADRLSLLADAIAAADPDIVTLQEVRLGTMGTAAIVADLAARHGLTYFAVEYGFVAGNGVLSKWPVDLRRFERLPTEEQADTFPDRRFAGHAVVESPYGPLDVYAMHFCAGSVGCSVADRTLQAEAFRDFVAFTHTSAHPAIVGADFNAHTGTAGDAQPTDDPPIDVLQDAGWISLLDGSDAPCNAPADRTGCTSGIDDLTVATDTTSERIDNIMIVPASDTGPVPPVSTAVEVGPTTRFGDTPETDPNPECHFDPRIFCEDDAACPAGAICNANDFCERSTPLACTMDAHCPDDLAPESCRTTLWISDHVGVVSAIRLDTLR